MAILFDDEAVARLRPKFQPRVTGAASSLIEDPSLRAQLSVPGQGIVPTAVAPVPAPASRAVPAAAAEAPLVPPVRALEAPRYIAADGTPTADWTKTAAYAEGVKRAEKDITEAALLDVGEAARRTSGASGERERKAAIARTRLRLDPTGGAAARRAEVATGLTAQQLAQAARLNQLQAQYLAEADPVKQAAIAGQLQALSGKGEEFKGIEVSGGERVETIGNIPMPVRQPGQLTLVGTRGTVRQVPIGQSQPAARPKDLNEFLTKARIVNPGMSDAELTAQYNRLYGKK